MQLPHLTHIHAAASRLAPLGVCHTPLMYLHTQGHARVYAKLECLQAHVRCYKVRGAFNVLATMQDDLPTLRQRGLVTASAGNFAIALGQAAHTYQVPLTVLVPQGAASAKLQALARLAPQAQVVPLPPDAWWQSMMQERVVGAGPADALFISPARNMAVMEANGTIGLEVLAQLPQDTSRPLRVYVPYGGGGLLIGMGAVLQTQSRAQVLACEVSTGAPFHAALQAGHPVQVPHTPSFVDGIGAPSVLPDNFERARSLAAGSVVLSPEAIMQQCQHMLHAYGLLVEGAGAASLAAAAKQLAESPPTQPTDVVCIVTGGNILPGQIDSPGNEPDGAADRAL